MKYEIKINVEFIDKKANIYLSQPKAQDLSFREMSHILVSTISLLVKLSEESGNIKDYELMKEITDHLNSEFVSITSFSDAKILNK